MVPMHAKILAWKLIGVAGQAQVPGHILDGQIAAPLEVFIGGGAVLPDGEADGGEGILLAGGLGQEAGQIAGEQIAAATLRQKGVAGAVDEEVAGGATRV